MMIFQSPPPTPYDLRFSVFGIPVRVHPLFWLVAILLGGTSGGLLNVLIWVAAIFTAILIHEIGHALAMRSFGQSAHIVLHYAGGLTVPESTYWGGRLASVGTTPNQQIFISFAGPGAGFLLAALILFITMLLGGTIEIFHILGFIPTPIGNLPNFEILNALFHHLLWVSIFWGGINLMPVYPLDGGSIARHIFIQYDPWDGLRKSLWLSVISGGILALLGLLAWGSLYMAVLFGFLAFQSYQSLNGRGY